MLDKSASLSNEGLDFLHYSCTAYRTLIQLIGTLLAARQMTTWDEDDAHALVQADFTALLSTQLLKLLQRILNWKKEKKNVVFSFSFKD